jgi:hypothetical protein
LKLAPEVETPVNNRYYRHKKGLKLTTPDSG